MSDTDMAADAVDEIAKVLKMATPEYCKWGSINGNDMVAAIVRMKK